MKLKTPSRPNYSRYAKLCDQTFYHDSEMNLNPPPNYIPPKFKDNNDKIHDEHQTTYGFTSVSRQKKGNFGFPIRLPHGQFAYYPDNLYGRSKSPSWSFPKRQKYEKQQLVEYEVCKRNPMFCDHEEAKMKASASSIKQVMKDKIKTMRTGSFTKGHNKMQSCTSMRQTKVTRNYSILDARQTSPVSFFNTSKIKVPRYFSKDDLNEMQAADEQKNYLKRARPNPKGYIEFNKKRARKDNFNSKGFQTYLTPYTDEKQYDNMHFSDHNINSPPVEMNKYLPRTELFVDKLGPNLANQNIPLDFSRRADNKINLLLSTFRNKIITRQDRVGEQPNTRLDYPLKDNELPGMLEMDRMMARNEQLFPIIDTIIKKAGDNEMKQELKRHIPIRQINQALRHKNVQDFKGLVNKKP